MTLVKGYKEEIFLQKVLYYQQEDIMKKIGKENQTYMKIRSKRKIKI
jgi:hypothetical protein